MTIAELRHALQQLPRDFDEAPVLLHALRGRYLHDVLAVQLTAYALDDADDAPILAPASAVPCLVLSIWPVTALPDV